MNTSVRYMVSNADDEDYEESEPATIAGTKTFNNLKDAFARKAMVTTSTALRGFSKVHV